MIHLYLVRHGIAEDAAAGLPDALRTLTEKARRRFRKTARSFGNRSGALDLILASPLVRAVQTAEILAGEVKHAALGVLPELSPEHAPDALLKAVSRRARKIGSIALVGHEPQLSKLVAALARLPAAQAAKLDIRPGAVVRVDVAGLPQPQAKKAEARWWIRSGGRHKGLPWNKAEARARKKRVAAARSKKTAPAAQPGKEARPPPKPKAGKSSAPVKSAPLKSAPVKSAPLKSAPKAAPQKFVGSPRPAAPAPVPAPAAPPPAVESPDAPE